MQELETPWTHWFFRSSEGGRALIADYFAAKGDEPYAGMDAQQIDNAHPGNLSMLALFSGIAVFLAAVGLYGVVAYTVTQRTQEIGVRMAIGAQPGQVMRMVVGGGLRLAAIGVVLGTGAALLLSRFIATMLFGVTPFDATSYILTASALLLVATLACYVPARRAMRVDPLVALRQE